MINLKYIGFLFSFLMICNSVSCSDNVTAVKDDYNREKMPHPCLLLKKGEEEKIKSNIAASTELNSVSLAVFAQANQSIKSELPEYILKGKRLLDVSRQTLQNLYSLSYAYRMSKKECYLERAILELETVCRFPDWNPTHFLDVAEMTMAVSIAYDWLYSDLPQRTRQLVERSITEKSFDIALDTRYDSFYDNKGNWNQVCNAGLLFGAFAIYDKNPAKADRIITKYRETMPVALNAYLPDGAYPEGFTYWTYGTGFQAMLNCALETLGMSTVGEEEGLDKSAEYYFHMVGPTGKSYNYYDGSDDAVLDPTMFYFAAKKNDPSLLYWELKHIKNKLSPHRLLASILVYSKDMNLSSCTVPIKKTWTGGGVTPVYLTRSAWDDANAAFLGIKGGTPSTSHGHMDNGSFIFEVNGVRWAIELGSEGYEKIEAQGVDLWNMQQESSRWDLLRYTNKFHNTITINDKKHKANGYVTITNTFEDAEKCGAVLDLTPSLFDVEKAIREIALVNGSSLQIKDVIKTKSDITKVQWTMVTTATVQVINSNKIELTKDNKKLELTINSPVTANATSWSCQPTTSYEGKNPNAVCIGFTANLPANEETILNVTLTPIN